MSKRSAILLAVTHLPSRPAKGELFTKKVICSVGSSMCKTGNGSK